VSLPNSIVYYQTANEQIVSMLVSVMVDQNKFMFVNVCTLPDYRRRGFASALIKHATSSFGQYTLKSLPGVSEWYENLGFRCVKDDWFCLHRESSEQIGHDT